MRPPRHPRGQHLNGPGTRTGDPFDRIRFGAIAAALEAVVTVDSAQRIVMVNPAAQRMFGRSAADLLGRDMSCLIPAPLREAHARHVEEFDRSGALELPRRARRQMVGLRADGEQFPIEAAVARVEVDGESGPRRYFTVLLRDLAAERDTAPAPAAVVGALRTFFELAPVAVWIAEGERIVYANPACAALFGTDDSTELIGRTVYALLDPASRDTVRDEIERALRTGAPARIVRERIQRLGGQVCEVDIVLASLPDHGESTMQMVISDVTWQHHERDLLERSGDELRRLSASLVTAREDERRRIARELHDEMGQWLMVLKMELAGLADPDAKEPLPSRLAQLSEMVDEVTQAVRRIAMDLRPMMLDDLGLNAAIEALARESARRMGIRLELRLPEADPPLGDAVAIGLYRIAQEALTNVARHAQASTVEVSLTQADGRLTLTVADDGVGFQPSAPRRDAAQGLIGLRERAFMFGGTLETGNRPGGGAFVRVTLPGDAAPAAS